MIKAVIFDMDGVIVDSEVIYLKQIADYMDYKGVPYTQEELNSLAGGTTKHYMEFVESHFGKGMSDHQMFEEINQLYGRFHDWKQVMFPHLIDLLEELKAKGYRMIVASSSRMWEIEDVTKELEITDFFEFYLSGEMFHESKPNPEIYLEAAKRLGLDVSECVVIEDSAYGIEAGVKAGMHVIARKDDRFGYDQSEAHDLVDDYRDVMKIIEKL